MLGGSEWLQPPPLETGTKGKGWGLTDAGCQVSFCCPVQSVSTPQGTRLVANACNLVRKGPKFREFSRGWAIGPPPLPFVVISSRPCTHTLSQLPVFPVPRDLVKKIRDTKGTFHAKMGLIKDRNDMDLTEAQDIRRSGRNIEKNYTKRSPLSQSS